MQVMLASSPNSQHALNFFFQSLYFSSSARLPWGVTWKSRNLFLFLFPRPGTSIGAWSNPQFAARRLWELTSRADAVINTRCILLVFWTLSSSAAHQLSSFSSFLILSSVILTFAIACSNVFCWSVSSCSSNCFWFFSLVVHSTNFFSSDSESFLRRWRIYQRQDVRCELFFRWLLEGPLKPR